FGLTCGHQAPREEAVVPTVRLPDDPSLEQLKNQAKTLQRFVRAGVPEALQQVREFHPRMKNVAADTREATSFSRADAQLVVARRLRDSGADATAGYLWEGLPSPYTALTGALSSAHSQPIDLARLLLERGADANDSQALYELGSAADDDTDALELLYEFGLGTGTGGIWHTRLAPLHPTPSQLVEDELIKAAAWNRPRRAQVVLRNPVH